jgi:hypothetical protein
MSKKKQQTHVRTITTGHVEADMLGQVYLWVSERTNRLNAQRFHRKTYKRRQPKSISEWSLTAPTACWRRLKELISYSNKYGRRLASVMRRNKRNGN